jgi:hypothetical protein
MAEWLQLVDKLTPSEDGGAKKSGRPEGLKKKAAKQLPIPGKNLAAKQKALARRLKVAKIDPAARQAARDAGFADSQTKMSQIAREPTPQAQLAAVKALANGSRKTPAKPRAVESDSNEPPLEVAKREFRRAKDLRRALRRLSEVELRLFLAAILAFVLGKEAEDERGEVRDRHDANREEDEQRSSEDRDDVDHEEDDQERDDEDDEDDEDERDDEAGYYDD